MPSIEGNIDNVMTKQLCNWEWNLLPLYQNDNVIVASLPRRGDGSHGGGGNIVIKIGGKNHLLYKRFNVFPLGFLSQHFHAGISFVFGQISVHFKCI